MTIAEPLKPRLLAARTCRDLFPLIGRDSWTWVPIASRKHEGIHLEGTRLTLVEASGAAAGAGAAEEGG